MNKMLGNEFVKNVLYVLTMCWMQIDCPMIIYLNVGM